MELQGKYGKAIVHTEEIESEAISQIISLLNQPMSDGAHVRIMPDVHSGAGCVIGYTARLTDRIVPNLIGVDIGCGVISWKLGKIPQKFDKLDKFIRKNIPSGRNINDEEVDIKTMASIFHSFTDMSLEQFDGEVRDVCDRTGQNYNYVWRSLGSLGGGNHFIEVDKDTNGELWLTIHCGSRNFGLKVAMYHQTQAEKQTLTSVTPEQMKAAIEKIKKEKQGKAIGEAITKLKKRASVRKHKRTGLEYLTGAKADQYFHDMNIAQLFAQFNRRLIGHAILTGFYKVGYKNIEVIESVHNYINFKDRIVRKGSISAHEGEKVIIPLNMADGIIVGTGKGNEDWNNSAPHGAGRRMSRRKAKESLSLEQFQNTMRRNGVWTSTADKHTLDEAPGAYKPAKKIIMYLKDTVKIDSHMKPVYNYKASE